MTLKARKVYVETCISLPGRSGLLGFANSEKGSSNCQHHTIEATGLEPPLTVIFAACLTVFLHNAVDFVSSMYWRSAVESLLIQQLEGEYRAHHYQKRIRELISE